jgi:hypothetical protein
MTALSLSLRTAVSITTAAALLGGCVEAAPTAAASPSSARSAFSASPNSCWGQASAVFARMGAMGEHASGFETPRLGLRNLARALAEAGVIPDDSMAALGAFVAEELGLSIEACR